MRLDKNKREILKGDLIRTHHFTGARRKRYWLYHTVVDREGCLWGVPCSHLEPTFSQSGGVFVLKDGECERHEIIDGYNPPWDTRKKHKEPAHEA